MAAPLELILEERGDSLVCLSPEVGVFTCALPRGAMALPGAPAGVLRSLGRSYPLVFPAGARGRIESDPPEAVHHPVGFAGVLYELAPLGADAGAAPRAPGPAGAAGAAELVFRAPHGGRFWRSPSPGEPAFIEDGARVKDGEPIGLLEVMKTFARVHYRARGGLPAEVRVLRFLVADGGEMEAGDPLLELEAP